MESMTGYAFLEKSTDQFSFSVELKSLNSKFLETFINLPRILRNDENEVQKIVKNNFSRGKIEVNIDIFDWVFSKQISLNADVIRKYYNELKTISRSLKLRDPISLESIVGLEGVSQKGRSVISERSRREIFMTIDRVIKKGIEMRLREGRSAKKDMLHSIAEISRMVAQIKKRSGNVVETKTGDLKKKLEAITGNKIDESRIFSEIAILADKLDINEEIVRLRDHLEKFRNIAATDEQIGRKLDFLAQEMFREINTIASKSNSSEISHISVDIKNYIDKIREQCRNIV
jgi:uncharacterized protein (TIGR00255 family)